MAKPACKNVVIVGGSLTGLCVAVVLKSLPQTESITVLERYEQQQHQDQGAGLRITSEFTELISTYAKARPEDFALKVIGALTVDDNGQVTGKIPAQMLTTSWGQCFRVLRESFDRYGKQSDREDERVRCSFRYGCKVIEVRERGSTVEVVFQADHRRSIESIQADLVVAADGASSVILHQFHPEIQRRYAGYVILRGLLPYSQLSPSTKEVTTTTACWAWNRGGQLIAYCVPDNEFSDDRNECLMNWGWYTNKPEPELIDLMTDADGIVHAYSLPVGVMRPELAQQIRDSAAGNIPPQFVEMVEKTEKPFLQVITDSLAPENVFMNGKVLLVGDAVGGQRPHTASATSQCAFHALLLGAYLQDHISLEEWSKRTYEYSRIIVETGRELGYVNMSPDIDPKEKATQYQKLFLENAVVLTRIWKDFQDNVLKDMKTNGYS